MLMCMSYDYYDFMLISLVSREGDWESYSGFVLTFRILVLGQIIDLLK